VLTFGCAGASSALRLPVRAGAVTLSVMAVMVSALTWTPAHAGGNLNGGCIGGWSEVNCGMQWGPDVNPFVRIVPQPYGEAEQARAIERDRKWLARCRPVVAVDRYGVSRYRYAAPGCEFGVGEN
jgi:hypothetical protein